MVQEIYCALCGVPFGVYPDLYRSGSVTESDVSWSQFFLALRKEKDEQPCDWYLSGVGRFHFSYGWAMHPPTKPDYDARELGADWPNMRDCDSALAYTRKKKPSQMHEMAVTEVLYPMHPPCWGIFLQSYALQATRDPLHPDVSKLAKIFSDQDLDRSYSGLIPSWAGDYNGPEQFWGDGWSYDPDPESSDIAGLLEVASQFDFLVHNPGNVQGFTELLEDPPPLAHSHLNHRSTNISWKADNHDAFSSLPTELLMQILCLLPLDAAQAVRLTSRAMASVSLGSEFWRSRFDFPHELWHVQLSQRFQTDRLAVDWVKLCKWLLHSTSKSWQNRKRITDLNGKLVKMLLANDDNGGIGERKFI